MKKIYILLTIAILFNSAFSQPLFLEQNSGVTTPLNYASPTNWFGMNVVSVWICGDNGVVLKTTNQSGGTWINVSGNGIPTSINLDIIAHSADNSIIALTAGIKSDTAIIYRTSNGGTNWQEVFRQYHGGINAITFNNTSGLIIGNPVGGRWSIWKTTNTGLSFDSSGMYLAQNGTESGNKRSFYVCNFQNIFFGTNMSRLYYSTNRGSSWSFLQIPDTNICSLQFTACFTPGLYYGYLGSSSKVLFTSNSGSNWIVSDPSPGTGNISGIYACPVPVSGYFGYNQIMATKNDNKVYMLPIYGTTWVIAYTAPSGNYRYLSNVNQGFNLWALRDNGGISWGNCGTGGIQKISEIIPNQFSLSQNFPNPFNPVTRIQFDVPVKSLVRMSIFDIVGKEIMRLVDQDLTSGQYQVSWDASNYPSGVYFYKLTAGEYTETKKMVLIK